MISIRMIHPIDAPAWVAMRAALWPDQELAALALDAERFFSSHESGAGKMPEAVLVARDGAAAGLPLVGFAEVSRRLYAEGCTSSPVGFLEGWYVIPERRREGVGSALVAAAEDWARSLGCREFASDALADNAISAVAHRAIGFEEVEVIRCFRKDLKEEPGTDHTPRTH